MNTILWIFIAFAFGLMLFVGLQDELPPELDFLKGTPGGGAAQLQPGTYQAGDWLVQKSGDAVELRRSLAPAAAIALYSAPELGILCANGKLDLRVNAGAETTGLKDTEVILNGKLVKWDKGTDLNIFPKNPKSVLSALRNEALADIQVSYVTSGRQRLTADTSALDALASNYLSECGG